MSSSEKQYRKIYTVGCFDHQHWGHEILFNRMREHGDKIIVGIHDDASIEALKGLKPDEHQNIETRMANVKKYVDSIFVIPNKDPTFYLQCMVQTEDNHQNCCYIRADDMPNFPGRDFVESKMSIKFLPYTQGVSSTQIRKENSKK